MRARYDQQIANKPREEEVHARHILVPDEATAKQVIAQLGKGADFAALSKQYSKDPGAAQQGGDLGWFKKSEMVPEFADAAFALQPGQIDPDTGAHAVRLARHPGAGPPQGAGAHVPGSQRRTAPDDDPGWRPDRRWRKHARR